MSNDNSDSNEMQTSLPSDAEIKRRTTFWETQRAELSAMISPSTDYKHLAWNIVAGIGSRGMNEKFMFDKECAVAARILQWLEDHPEYDYYRDYIKQVPYNDYVPLETTGTLHFNLWMKTDASLWLSTRDASSYADLLWVTAVMRLSRFLNTGEWQPPTTARQIN